MDAFDSAAPNQRVSANVTINVRRNANCPIFQDGTNKQLNIDDTQALASAIDRLIATDADKVSFWTDF